MVDYADLSEIGKEEEREAAKLSGVPLDVQRRQAEKEARQKAQLAAEKAREEDHARKVAERKAARAEAREKSGIKRPEAPVRNHNPPTTSLCLQFLSTLLFGIYCVEIIHKHNTI